jgi:acetoin utilization deacetylase AcuC-like enzyme
VLALEGGYNRPALGACVVASLRVLLGRDPGPDTLGPSDSEEPDLSALIARAKRHPLLNS